VTDTNPTDPVLIQRARASRLADLGQRIGYTLFGVAIVGFFVGLATDFSSSIARVVVASIIAGSVVLAPAIIAGYAVRAATKDDLEHGRDIG